jgi:hypothetical protein
LRNVLLTRVVLVKWTSMKRLHKLRLTILLLLHASLNEAVDPCRYPILLLKTFLAYTYFS